MRRPVKYLQTDPRWGGIDYSAPGEKTDIAESGCGPTSMAMVIATLKDSSVTPATTCAWSKAHGYKAPNQGTYYSYFKPQAAAYGLTVEQMNYSNAYLNRGATVHAQALQELHKGNWLISCMGPGKWTKSGHFILVYGTDESNVYINDPYSTRADKEKASIAEWQNEVKYYFKVVVPKEGDDMSKDEVIEIIEEYLYGGKNDTVADYAKQTWPEAKAKGIVDGTRPRGYATRQEVVTMISRALKG